MSVVSDNFNRTNENPITTPWVVLTGTPTIYSNRVGGVTGGSGYGIARYGSSGVGAAQYSKATAAVAGTEETYRRPVVCVRCATGANTWYGLVSGSTTSRIVRCLAGTLADIATGGTRAADGQLMRLEVSGTTLTAYINGVQVLQVTDANIASGDPGMGIQSDFTQAVDNWEGGDLASGNAGTQRGVGRGIERGIGRGIAA